MNVEEHPSAPLPVVAVLVTHDAPEDRLAQVLQGLAAQDHPNLDVLVVDTGTRDPTEHVRAVLPSAEVRRVDGNPGFGTAANIVLDIVSGAEFYVFCHDDAVPGPGAVSALVAAAERSGADLVGPKLVEWDDPRCFTQFGLTVDKAGVPMPFVERGELDQGQHDGMRDVFAVPGAFTLVRASRFVEVGGFDEAIWFLGDDVSLAWRARVAGARVVVTPHARVRHAEATTSRHGAGALDRLAARHRVRVLLTSYRWTSLVRVVPQALVLTLVEALGAVVTGRPGRARSALGAWPWNLWRLRSLRAARRHVARFRRVGDGEVRRYQVRGLVGPRVTLLRVGADGRTTGGGHGAGSRRVAAVPERGRPDVDPAAWSPATVLVALGLAAVVALGSRHLITRFVPVVGEMVPMGAGSADLLGSWAGGWRSVGLGAEGATPTLAAVAGLLGGVLAGHIDLARTVLVVGLLPLGVIGAHRLLAPTGSKRAQVAAAVAYTAVPLPYDALAAGRWSVLGAYAAAPWMLGRLARASGMPPFGAGPGPVDDEAVPGGVADDPVVRHRLWKHVVAVGAVTALLGLFVPQAPGLLVLVGLALVAGTFLAGAGRGAGRLLAATVGGATVAVVLHLPVAVDALSSRNGVEALLGPSWTSEGLSAPDLLALRTGPTAIDGVAFALLAAAALPLLVGRRWRLGWAIRAWTLAVASWGLVWANEQGWVSLRLPDTGVVLAPAAAGLALAVGLGLAAFDRDVQGRSWRVGLRSIAVGLAVVALVASTASTVAASLDGWWGMPRDDYAGLIGFVDDDVSAVPSRVLWVGDPQLLPGGDGWPLGGRGVAYTASTARAVPAVTDLWPTVSEGASERLGDALTLAVQGDTTRLGRLLAPMGVGYVAVPRRLAPSGPEPQDAAVDDVVGALAQQLDLEHLRVDRGLVLYRNTATAPLRSAARDPGALAESSVAAAGTADQPAATGVLADVVDAREARGTVPGGTTVVQASTSSPHWRLIVGGERADRRVAYGWADAFTVDDGGPARIVYDTPVPVRALAAAQAVLWLAVLGLALRMRFGAGEPPTVAVRVVHAGDEDAAAETDAEAGGGTGAGDERATVPARGGDGAGAVPVSKADDGAETGDSSDAPGTAEPVAGAEVGAAPDAGNGGEADDPAATTESAETVESAESADTAETVDAVSADDR